MLRFSKIKAIFNIRVLEAHNLQSFPVRENLMHSDLEKIHAGNARPPRQPVVPRPTPVISPAPVVGPGPIIDGGGY